MWVFCFLDFFEYYIELGKICGNWKINIWLYV